MTTVGTYINLCNYDCENPYDVFIILNEPNDSPTPNEVGEIEEIASVIIERNLPGWEDELVDKLEGLFNCTEFGVQIVVNRR